MVIAAATWYTHTPEGWPMRSIALLVVLGLVVVGPLGAQDGSPRRGQEVIAEEALRDHDYLFQLKRPAGTEWRLVAEAEAHELSQEAVAAMVRAPSPVFGAIVVERLVDGNGSL